MYDEPYGAMQESKVCEVANPSPLEQLRQQKIRLEAKLTDCNNAIQALEENSAVLKVLELLAKARH